MKIVKRKFAEEIAQAIQHKIVELDLHEGDRLPSHAALAKELDVSIPSLREGLQQLTTLGVLQISHGSGTIVVKPKVSDYFRILSPRLLSKPRVKEEYTEVLSLLEPHIASRLASAGGSWSQLKDSLIRMNEAAERDDVDQVISEDLFFHRRLARLSGNSVLAEILSIVNRLLLSSPGVAENTRKNMGIIIRDHTELIKAFEKKDSTQAREIMLEHVSLLGRPAEVSIVYDTFSTGSIGGSFYSVGRELCRILYKYAGIPIESEPTGGGIENVELTSEGKAILGLTQSDVAHYAFQGKEPFSFAYNKIRAVCSAHSLDLWIVVSASSSISSMNDLLGKRIAMGAMGGESVLIAKALLDVYGYKDGDYRPFYLSISNAVQGIRNSNIDVIFYLSSGSGSALAELAEDMDIRLLAVDSSHSTSILKTHTYWKKSIIHKDLWPGLETDVPTLGISSLLITHEDVPAGVIKTITSVIMEHADEIDFEFSDGSRYGMETAFQGVSIPLHPGAEEYFKEKGLNVG